jgi:general nucleoside transport system permease protein
MNILFLVFQQTMFFSIPLLIVALGGVFTERGGVTNIALDGMMIMGAFAGIFFINQMQGQMSGQLLLILAILISTVTGMVFSLLHAYASINMKSDQIISGTALNMFAPAFAIFTARMIQSNGVQQIQFDNTFRIHSVPVLGDIPIIGGLFFQNAYITTYLGFIILAVSVIVLYKTRFGLRLRACGEHPHAADSVGINVYKMRYAGVMISGALSGLGGLVFVIPTSTNFNETVAGYGFLALAVMIFGQWKPLRVLFAAFFFGLMKTIASTYSVIPILATAAIPSDVYKMIPFIATLIVLAFSSKASQAPRAVAVPYDKGSR